MRIIHQNAINPASTAISEWSGLFKRLGNRGQTSTEYMLLIALGLAIVIVSIAVANQIKSMTDSLMLRTELERNATIAMLIK